MPADWPGHTPEGALLLQLDAVDYAAAPAVLALPECTLVRKHEFHVTVLGRAAGAAVIAAIGADGLAAAWRGFDWTIKRTGACRLLRRTSPTDGADGRTEPVTAWSVIEVIESPAMAAFRRVVARLACMDLPEAPAHVTLHVAGDAGGIGVPDHAALEVLTARVLTAAEAALACSGQVERA